MDTRRASLIKMLTLLKQKIRSKIAIWQYTRWYRKMSPYYKENPHELKLFCIKTRWKAQQTNSKALHWFADWMEGWLKQEGHW